MHIPQGLVRQKLPEISINVLVRIIRELFSTVVVHVPSQIEL